MAKHSNLSRLKETAFSRYNLRDAYISEIAEYIGDLRDSAIFDNYGTKVLIRIPLDDNGELKDNFVDEYNNFVNINWMDTSESVVPLFKEYRQVLSEEGMTADGVDGIYPLEVIIPSKLHLPRNSRIVFNEYNCREEKVAREWTVLGTVMKQLSDSKTYSRIANCVPSRQSLYNNIETALGTIWFDWNKDCKLDNYNNIRAQGTIWFLRNGIDQTKVKKIIQDGIWEQVPEYPQYFEQVESLMYYDSRSQHIIESTGEFNIGDEFELLDEAGEVIYIVTDEEKSTKEQLYLTITKVSDVGEILEFKLNIERGYTMFGKDGIIDVRIQKEEAEATIELVSIPWVGENLQETLEAVEILAPKYIHPYKLDVVFSAKPLAISVLN